MARCSTAEGRPTLRYARARRSAGDPRIRRPQDLELATHASGEAQAAAIADDIAYNAHDIDDGLRAGLFGLEALREVPFLDELLREIDGRYPGLETSRRIHELTRRVITRFVEDVGAEGDRRLAALDPASADDIRRAPASRGRASRPDARRPTRRSKASSIRTCTGIRSVMGVRRQADAILRDLFARFMATPRRCRRNGSRPRRARRGALARRVADYIAGMTDRYAHPRAPAPV